MTSPAVPALWESNFGIEAPFALGVEEELLLVGNDLRPLERGAEVVEAAEPEEGELVGELFKSMVESNSDVSRSASDATSALREIRRDLLDSGSRVMGVGVHPDVRSGEAEVGGSPRYEAIKADLQGILRTPICGQHIHVGMPDEASALRAYNGIRTHVPLLNALAANSPFWFGRDSGLASARTVIFRSYPRAGMAPPFEDINDFTRVTREVCLAAGLDDYTHIWWDVRLHPGLGTVEIRAADAQSDLRRVEALSALIHCLTRIEAERDQDGIPSREALAESSFQATRHGLEATLLDRDARPVPARELARSSLGEAAEVAGELSCEVELAHVEKILTEGNGAELQRRAFATGGMDGLLEFLAQVSAQMD
ncbi:MAG: YbdK family carboxylate-amine ligase [Actinomycetota bacterium]|nr:YbdK family carboxylate-amine ligase [Actinomycetota bacterium]